MAEALEDRLLFSGMVAAGTVPWALPRLSGGSASTDDRISDAAALGAMSTDHSIDGTLGTPTDVNLYSLTAQSGQQVAFDIDHANGSSLDAYLRLFDSAGHELAFNDSGSAPNEGTAGSDPYLTFTFSSSGTYYVGVSNGANAHYDPVAGGNTVAGSQGTYTLNAAVIGGSSGFNGITATATRPTDQSTSSITIRRFLSNGTLGNQGIDPTQRTWVLIHGYNGNGTTNGIISLDTAIATRFPSDQILTLDWSQAASDPSYTGGEQWVPGIATAAAKALIAHGFAGSSINFVGYSFGSEIAGESAKGFSGGVNTIIGIDPPVDVPGQYDPRTSLNFAAVSQESWTFHDVDTTHSGDPIEPTTADEAIDVTGTTHGAMIGLVANILKGVGTPSARFTLDRLLAHTPGPWKLNQYDNLGNADSSGLYEAVLTTTGGAMTPATLTYMDLSSGQSVTE